MIADLPKIFFSSYQGYAQYLWFEISTPRWDNYFYWLLGLSLLCWFLELAFPWRKEQKAVRQDFWLDAWYMMFNFFVFSLIGYNAMSNVVVVLVDTFMQNTFGWSSIAVLNVQQWPWYAQLLLLLIVRDFVQWNIHRLLHAVPWLWRFHQVHHSVQEMGFAAHLRYHWMETIVYRGLEYMPLALIGFGLKDFFAVHIFTLAIGHLNHSNVYLPLGPLRFVLNNPQMHIWHHAKDLPRSTGVNFGLTLSVWDYLFGTAYTPHNGHNIPLGFDNVERYPTNFFQQTIEPFRRHRGVPKHRAQ
jgi:sterol desaturase/sphingolipid hydroxylase (fatty acid hydroxylase superfamily)